MPINWNGTDEDAGIYAGWVQRASGDVATWIARAVEVEQPTPGETEFVASTGSVDRMSDVIDQETWKLAAFRANPVILYEHHDPVVGSGKVAIVGVGKDAHLRLKVRWDASEVNPLGMLAAHQHANGFRNAVSVGFMPGEAKSRRDLPEGDPLKVADTVDRWAAGYLFRQNELLEVSTVGVPANREAVQLSLHARATDDPDEAVKRFVRGSMSRQIADLVLDAVRHDKRIRRAISAAYLGTPPDSAPSPSVGPSWVR